jgi:hypothetical protein
MLRSFMLALALIASSCAARAEPLRTPDDVRALTQAMMERLSKGKINEAFQMATPHWPLPGNELDLLTLKTTQQMNLIEQRFGKVLGFELVRDDLAGEWARRMTYVEKRERHVIRWQFTFYRPQNVWLMNGLTFDDNMQTLFER